MASAPPPIQPVSVLKAPATPVATPGAPPVHEAPILGVKTLVFGGTGNGKTHSLRTLKDAGIKLFVIFTENGMEALEGTDPEWVDWHYIPAAKPDMQAMINMAKQINTLDRKQLAAYQDPFRSRHQQLVEVYQTLANLKGDRTGKVLGPVEKLSPEYCVAIDSLSGLGVMAKGLVGGDKPVYDQGEWGMAMDRLEKTITMLCMACPCHIVLNAHEERETDEISGSTKIMVSAPGRKLAPKIPFYFDNVFYAFRKDKNWNWSTNYPGVADLKSRSLGIFDSAPQHYGPVMEAWRKKRGQPTP